MVLPKYNINEYKNVLYIVSKYISDYVLKYN